MDDIEKRVADNLERVRKRIGNALHRSGRPEGTVRLVAVTKTVGPAEIEVAAGLGVKLVGENRVQQALDKKSKVQAELQWHMIGNLQRRKVRDTVDNFDMIHSVDRVELAGEISKRAGAACKVMPVLIEVNTSGEPNKHGIAPAELPAFIENVAHLDGMHVRGLMTMGPFVADPEQVRPCFVTLRECAERIRAMDLPGIAMTELSMGMTNDFEVAIEEGATMVRIGTAIFGTLEG
jgi:hypothetical protein